MSDSTGRCWNCGDTTSAKWRPLEGHRREDMSHTITTAKGTHTGSLYGVCRWQATMQGAYADIDGVSVNHVDFDGADLPAAVDAVLTALVDDSDLLERFRAASAEAGDLDAVAICDRALLGDDAAKASVVTMLGDAAAMDDAPERSWLDH